MPLYASNGGGGDIKICPPGLHKAWCYGLIDFGEQTQVNNGKASTYPKARLLFELVDVLDDKGQPMTIGKTYSVGPAGLTDRSTFRKHVQSWRGRPFTKEELDKFVIDKLVGHACKLVVSNQPKTSDPSKMTDGIDNIFPPDIDPTTKRPLPQNKCSRPNLIFIIEDWDQQVYESLPKWMKDEIAKSPEGRAKLSGRPAQPATVGGQPQGGGQPPDDYIPF